MFARFKSKLYIITSQNKRLFSAKGRRYPVNPEDSKSLPIFEYGVSKDTYQRVFVWGNIRTGALGVPYFKSDGSFLKVEYLQCPKRLSFAEKYPVVTAACGFGFSAFAVSSKDNVKLYSTGLNTDAQIGYHAIRAGHPMEIVFSPLPIPLPFKNPEKSKILKVSAGRAHLVVLSDEGMFLLGNNSYGQCGRRIIEDENYFHSNYINFLPDIEGNKIIDIECGQDHTFAITSDGSVYSCGWGADGQTGLDTFKNTSEFTLVKGDIENEKIVKISSRSDFVLALNDRGDAFGWGNAEYDQIKTINNAQQVANPGFLQNLAKFGKMKDVAAGGSFCAALNDKGQVFVWGYGILGAGPKVAQSSQPIKLPETLFGKNDFQPDNQVISINCGLSYAVAITNLGDIYAWGRNLQCCLGLGDEKNQYFPFKVSLGGYAKAVFCGVDHTIAICKPFI